MVVVTDPLGVVDWYPGALVVTVGYTGTLMVVDGYNGTLAVVDGVGPFEVVEAGGFLGQTPESTCGASTGVVASPLK